MNLIKPTLVVVLAIAFALWLNNTSRFVDVFRQGDVKLIAHRGVHQIYSGDERTASTCRARAVAPFSHDYIENTLPSMRAAFDYGADIVEIDVHLTIDNVVAVFHDWTLDCQTNGRGVTNQQEFSYLKGLDLGYNITHDGEAYPLRGKATGMMPRLDEVLSGDFDGQFLVNVKSDRIAEGRAIVDLLQNEAMKNRVWGVYGGAPSTRVVLAAFPELKGYDKGSLKACALAYLALGWSGYVPKSCHDQVIGVPANFTWFVWGWPHKFTERMRAVNTEVILWGPYDGSGFTSGIDSLDDPKYVPENFNGYVWTNRIEVIGPALRDHALVVSEG